MLFHLFCWAAVAVPCLLLGVFIERRSCPTHSISGADHAIVSFYIGLVSLSAILLALSLLLPVSPIALALIIAGILALTLFDENSLKESTSFGLSLLNRRTVAGVA